MWLVPLELSGDASDASAALLSEDEAVRARGMAAAPRRRYTASRVALRRLLDAYLRVGPGNIQFRYGPRGKPELARDRSGTHPRFNVSHSGDWALVGVGLSPLGVDIESTRERPNAESVARRFFSASENETLSQLPTTLRNEAFLRCWTRKEAYAKAVGEGVAIGFRDFEVGADPRREPALIRSDGTHDPEWAIRDLHPGSGLVGAIAVNRRDCTLRCWKLVP